jgi:hypothetical protein
MRAVEPTPASPKAREKSTERPLILYSCYTWISYQINQSYYGGYHYVWCTRFFNPNSPFCRENAVPPTSSPFEIYKNLYEEVRRGERHSAKIKQNCVGILRGADIQRRNGTLQESAHRDISSIVSEAQIGDFRPLIFVIPFEPISERLKQVSIKDRAHPLSQEFIVERLGRHEFDIIELY